MRQTAALKQRSVHTGETGRKAFQNAGTDSREAAVRAHPRQASHRRHRRQALFASAADIAQPGAAGTLFLPLRQASRHPGRRRHAPFAAAAGITPPGRRRHAPFAAAAGITPPGRRRHALFAAAAGITPPGRRRQALFASAAALHPRAPHAHSF